MQEIEAKFGLEQWEVPILCKALMSWGASVNQAVSELNVIFDTKKKELQKSDSMLRLRIEKDHANKGEQSVLLTFKGPKKKSKFKSRPEFQTFLGSPYEMVEILHLLGYQEQLEFEKVRFGFGLKSPKPAFVQIDVLPLGTGRNNLAYFCEIEGKSDADITAVMKALTFKDKEIIKTGYASMMAKLKKKHIMIRNKEDILASIQPFLWGVELTYG